MIEFSISLSPLTIFNFQPRLICYETPFNHQYAFNVFQIFLVAVSVSLSIFPFPGKYKENFEN